MAETDRAICVVCDQELEDDKMICIRARAIKKLFEVSIKLKDRKHEKLEGLCSLNIHKSCQKMYTSDSYYKKEVQSKSDMLIRTKKERKEARQFDFAKMCFFCATDVEKCANKNPIRKVTSDGVKENILEKLKCEPDTEFNRNLKLRLLLIENLQEKSARYHAKCMQIFYTPRQSSKRGRPKDENISRIVNHIINHLIENSDDSQFSLKELLDNFRENLPRIASIKEYLMNHFGDDLVLHTVPNDTIICFVNRKGKELDDQWYNEKAPTVEEEVKMNHAMLILSMSHVYLKRRKLVSKRKEKEVWVRDWLMKRKEKGCTENLINELDLQLPALFTNFLRMSRPNFDLILGLIRPIIEKQDTVLREAISASDRLMVTLRYLGTGDSFKSLSYLFRISQPSITKIIPETCDAIFQSLKDKHLKFPSSEEEWKKISKDFSQRWNFPQCLGAIDGKHVAIRAPANAGSLYYNYKNFHSIVLMAVGDANYRLIYVDVGSNGRNSDGGVFNRCSLSHHMKNNSLHLPPPNLLANSQVKVPYCFVCDDAFSIGKHMMKPFSNRQLNYMQRIFNYRLSRARRVIENIFGIITKRFCVFEKPMNLEPGKAKIITLATCVLHNFLIDIKSPHYVAETEAFEAEEEETQNQEQLIEDIENDANQIRNQFMEWFLTPGAGEVDFQYQAII